MTGLFYWLTAILLLSLLIVVHELGHFYAARLCGLRVVSFGIGFGPKLWSRMGKDGVQYTVRALPLGGYCRFYGEDEQVSPDAEPLRPGVPPFTEKDALYRQPVWKRAVMIAAGPLMNFALAIVVILLVYTLVGLPVVQPFVGAVDPESPAAEAGLMPGDWFLEVNGTAVASTETVQTEIAQNTGVPVDLVMQRGTETFSVRITPRFDEALGYARIGINFGQTRVTVGLGRAIPYTFQSVGNMVTQIFGFLRGLITSGAGVGDMAGPIGAIAIVKEETQANGLLAYLTMAASISVNLGLFNLLPIPGLDGSRLIFLGLEAVRRKRIDPNKEGLVHLIGVGVLLLLMLPVYIRDILRLFQ